MDQSPHVFAAASSHVVEFAYVQQRPRLPQEHFLNVVYGAVDVDVLFITGMRDEAPVPALSHLVPGSRLLEVRVNASEETRRVRRGCHDVSVNVNDDDDKALDYQPSFVFDNDTTGDDLTKGFAEQYLLPYVHEDLQRLATMVGLAPNFPRPGINFRHVLDISQQPGGLAMCTSLLRTHFTGDWARVDVIACCEAGGFVYASALASQVDIRLAVIRQAGKLPPPTISAVKSPSHISSVSKDSKNTIEMGRDVSSERRVSIGGGRCACHWGDTLCGPTAVTRICNQC